MEIIYKGYSTHNYSALGGTFSLTNIDLVNLDLLNHIYTERNERVMMPTFGTSIPTSVHEPLTEQLIENIRDDLETVFNYDPRVEKLQLIITPFYESSALVASATLRYIEYNVIEELNFAINIDGGE